MPDNPDTSQSKAMQLPNRLDLTNAGALRDFYLEAECSLVIDASEVEVVTTAGLQVLMAGRDWSAEQGHTVTIDDPSPQFQACLGELGATLDRVSHTTDAGQAEVS